MPFTPEQIRAIAADRNRRHGDAGPYLHKLKAKTLRHKEQWGNVNVKKSSRYGGTGTVGTRDDEFSKSRRSNHAPESDRQRRMGAYMATSGGGGAIAAGLAGRRGWQETKNARAAAVAANPKAKVKYLTAHGGRTKLLAAVGAGGLAGAARIHRYASSSPNTAWT